MKPTRLIGAGTALAAGTLAFGLAAPPVLAAPGEGQHNEVHEEEVDITDYDHNPAHCYVYYGTSLNSPERRYESWIFAEGDAACYGAFAAVTVSYVEQDGGDGYAEASGHGAFAQSVVLDVQEPYESRSYQARHVLYWNSCGCQVTRTTSPK